LCSARRWCLLGGLRTTIMNLRVLTCTLLSAFATATTATAQVLAIDFNDRSSDPAANTYPGFDSFLIESNISATAIQTNSTTRFFPGGIGVTVSGAGGNPGYDDRLRSAAQQPPDNGDFTQNLLLRDFIFSPDNTTAGGLNFQVTGLIPGVTYRIFVWAFDTQNTGSRVSDWFVNGALAYDNFVFNGSILPTNNAQYRAEFKGTATEVGELLIQGRRDASSAGVSVFVCAMQLDESEPDAATNAILTGIIGSEVYAGDKIILAAQNMGGTPPFTYHWVRDGTVIAVTSTPELTLTNGQVADSGLFTVAISNDVGVATSAPLTVDYQPVENLGSGLIVYWPVDTVTDYTDDVVSNRDLWANNLLSGSVPGQRGNAVSLNGVDQYLVRTNDALEELPAVKHPAYSIALWVKGYGTNQQDRRVFAESSNLSNTPLMTIGTDNAGNNVTNVGVDIFVRASSGSTPINHRKTSLPAFDGNWHHIVWVDNNGSAKVYVDGVADTNNFDYVRTPLLANLENVGVIVRNPPIALFNGLIDDIAIWRRSLTATEVMQVMTSGPLPVSDAPRFTRIEVGVSSVTLQFTSSNPSGTHVIEQATDLGGTPITWSEVMGATFSVSGDTVTAQFPRPASAQTFFRVRQ
jgi:hypothetical protein